MGTKRLSTEDLNEIYDQGRTVAVPFMLDLVAENEQLRKENEQLRTKLKVARQVSPAAPSGSIPPFKKPDTSNGGKKRRKKPGRKKGHRGSARKPPAHIEKDRYHKLPETCPHCGEATPRGKSKWRSRVIEGLDRISAAARRHWIEQGTCANCGTRLSAIVTEAMPGDTINLYTFVFTAWLHYGVGMSIRNIVHMCKLSGLGITPGALVQGWQRMAERLEPAYDQILEQVKGSLVLYADETSWRIWGVTHWLWYFGTKTWSYYVIDRHRSAEVIYEVLGDVIDGILITDFYAAYNAIKAMAKQKCIFHLFVEIKKVDQRKGRDPTWQAFRRRVRRFFKDAIALAANDQIDQLTYDRRKERIRQRFETLLLTRSDDADAERLLDRLARHHEEMLTFLDYPGIVNASNSHGEQQMRNPVISRRISQGNRSERGARTQAILMSLMRSAQLQKRDPVLFLLNLLVASISGRPVVLPPVADDDDRALNDAA